MQKNKLYIYLFITESIINFSRWEIVIAFLRNIRVSAQTFYSIYNVCVGRNNAFSATTYLWTIWAIMTHNWKSSIRKGGIKWQANSSKCKECAEHVIEDLLLTIFLLKKTNYWTLCIILCLLKRANICHAAIIFLVGFLLCILGIRTQNLKTFYGKLIVEKLLLKFLRAKILIKQGTKLKQICWFYAVYSRYPNWKYLKLYWRQQLY